VSKDRALPFLTSVLHWGEWSASFCVLLTPGEVPSVATGLEDWWAPGPVGTLWGKDRTPVPVKIWAPVVQPIACCYTDKVIPTLKWNGILCHVPSLLGNDRKTGEGTAAAHWQQPANDRGIVFSARSTKQQLNSHRGTAFSVKSMLGCYKKFNWSNELNDRQKWASVCEWPPAKSLPSRGGVTSSSQTSPLFEKGFPFQNM
jgi:hypothetical protein